MKKTLMTIAVITSASSFACAKDAGTTLTTQPLLLKDKIYNVRYERSINRKMSYILGTELFGSPSLNYAAGSLGIRGYISDEHKGFYLGGSLYGMYADINDPVYNGPLTTGHPEAELGYKWSLPLHLTADAGVTAPVTDLDEAQLGFRVGLRW